MASTDVDAGVTALAEEIIASPLMLPYLGWREIAALSCVCKSFNARLLGHDTTGAWRALCENFALDKGLYAPSRCHDWKALFWDMLWPSRGKWLGADSAANGQGFKINVAVRFRPAREGDQEAGRDFVLPLHQRLKLLQKGEQLSMASAGVGGDEVIRLLNGSSGDGQEIPPEVLAALQEAGQLAHVAARAEEEAARGNRRRRFDAGGLPGGEQGDEDRLAGFPDAMARMQVANGEGDNNNQGRQNAGALDSTRRGGDEDDDNEEGSSGGRSRRCGAPRVLALSPTRAVMFVPGVGIRPFQFGRVFAPEASQVDVFESLRGTALAAVNGFNAALLCYGQTGSGKTHTLYGPPGAVDELARGVRERQRYLNYAAAKNSPCDAINSGAARGSQSQSQSQSQKAARQDPGCPVETGDRSADDDTAASAVSGGSQGRNPLPSFTNTGHKGLSSHGHKGSSLDTKGQQGSTLRNAGSSSQGHEDSSHGHADLPDSCGLVLRLIQELLLAADALSRDGTRLAITMQYVEVYQDAISDLLGGGRRVVLRERSGDEGGDPINAAGRDPRHYRPRAPRFVLQGALEAPIASLGDAVDRLLDGEKLKRFAATAMNERSSRAHTVLVLQIVQTSREGGPGMRSASQGHNSSIQARVGGDPSMQSNAGVSSFIQSSARGDMRESEGGNVWTSTNGARGGAGDPQPLVVRSELTLVDLAGCEHVKLSKVKAGVRLQETISINSSLLVLGKCITALVEERPHVPYYESTLTQLLRGAFGGNSRTTAVITAASDPRFAEHTLQALRFGEKCAAITNVASLEAMSLGAARGAIEDALATCREGLRSLEARGKTRLPAYLMLKERYQQLLHKGAALFGLN